jgi:hypothetical protein
MKREYKNILALPMSVLLGISALSGCSSSGTSTQNSAEEEETVQETSVSSKSQILEPAADYYIEYAEKEDNTLSLNIVLCLVYGSFSDDFDADMIEFGGDLAEAAGIKVDTIDKELNTAEIWVSLENTDLDVDDLSLQSTLSLKEGAVLNADDEACDELVFDKDLTFSDADRSETSNLTEYWFKKTGTYVVRVKNEGVYGWNIISDACYETTKLESVSYIVLDLSQTTNLVDDLSEINAVHLLLLPRKFTPTCVVINANDYITQKLQEYKEYYPEAKVQLVYGDVSSLNFNNKNVYSSIQSMIKSGKLKEN